MWTYDGDLVSTVYVRVGELAFFPKGLLLRFQAEYLFDSAVDVCDRQNQEQMYEPFSATLNKESSLIELTHDHVLRRPLERVRMEVLAIVTARIFDDVGCLPIPV